MLTGRNTVTAIGVDLGERGRIDVVVKSYGSRGLTKLKSLVQLSKAAKAWRGARALIDAGLRTAPPIAYFERRRGGFVARKLLRRRAAGRAGRNPRPAPHAPGASGSSLSSRPSPESSPGPTTGGSSTATSRMETSSSKTDGPEFRFYFLDTNRIRVRRRLGAVVPGEKPRPARRPARSPPFFSGPLRGSRGTCVELRLPPSLSPRQGDVQRLDRAQEKAPAQNPGPEAEDPMKFKFAWNELADQPHNVAPRSERTRHHVRHWRTYLSLIWANLLTAVPEILRYRRLRREMFRRPVAIDRAMFAVAVSPRPGRNEEVLALLEETGVRETLLRVPSWEKDRLAEFEEFARLVRSRGIGLTIALLQRREDVFEAGAWARFVEDVFSRFAPLCRPFRDRPRLEPDQMGRLGLHRVSRPGPAGVRPAREIRGQARRSGGDRLRIPPLPSDASGPAVRRRELAPLRGPGRGAGERPVRMDGGQKDRPVQGDRGELRPPAARAAGSRKSTGRWPARARIRPRRESPTSRKRSRRITSSAITSSASPRG